MRFKKITAAALAALMIAIPAVSFAEDISGDLEEQIEVSGEYEAFEKIAQYVSERYIDDSFSKEDIMQKGLSALLENNNPLLIDLLKATLESMDDYSEFFTAEEYNEYINQFNQTFYGIGIVMRQSDDGNYVEIIGFSEENGKAEEAGFRIGDKICKVNGTDVTGWKLSDTRELIVGKEGTTVEVTVLRDGVEINITATRVAVSENTVTGGILNGNIGYIQLTSFNAKSVSEFETNLNFMRDHDVKKIIIDLRNNGGGLVSAAVDIAEMIVPKGKIIDVKFRESQYDATYNSNLAHKEFDFAVLVNEYTASSAEILASAIQDSGAGVLIGTQTYGKAVIQNQYPLSNGMVFKLTVGQYITRNGREINHVGLTPDKEVENVIEKIDDTDYTKFDFATRTSFGDTHSNVTAAKERLYMLRFYDGETDSGVFTEELKESVRNFQQANSLLPNAVLDVATQLRINNLFLELESTEDKQLTYAYEFFGGSRDDLYLDER